MIDTAQNCHYYSIGSYRNKISILRTRSNKVKILRTYNKEILRLPHAPPGDQNISAVKYSFYFIYFHISISIFYHFINKFFE